VTDMRPSPTRTVDVIWPGTSAANSSTSSPDAETCDRRGTRDEKGRRKAPRSVWATGGRPARGRHARQRFGPQAPQNASPPTCDVGDVQGPSMHAYTNGKSNTIGIASNERLSNKKMGGPGADAGADALHIEDAMHQDGS
jgi:hypothetical protein